MIRTGLHVSAWINDDDPTLGAGTPVAQVVAEVKDTGAAGLELGATDIAPWAAACNAAGVRLIGAAHGLNLLQRHMGDEKARLAPLLEQARAAGARVLSVYEITESIHDQPRAPLSERPELPEHLWQPFGKAIEEIAEFAEDYDVKLMYQPRLGTMVQTPAEVAALMDATGPATKLVFDSAEVVYAGGDPEALLSRHLDRIGHIHLGNVRPRVMDFGRANDWPYLAAVRAGVFTVAGDPDGGLDLDALLKVAQSGGYSGWVVSTGFQDPGLRAPIGYQTLAARHLETIITTRKAGRA